MKAYQANMAMLETVVSALSKLPKEVCYVGGATTVLYLERAELDYIRPTEDIDCVVEVTSYLEYDALSAHLRGLGFQHPIEKEPVPICRWEYQRIKVDVMPTDESVLGFSNRWYSDGIRLSEEKELPSGKKLRIFTVSYFLASKLEAFFHRGNSDYQASKDLEDIVTVLDGRRDLRTDLVDAAKEVKEFVLDSFDRLSNEEDFLQSLAGHLNTYADPEERSRRIVDILRNLR